MGESHVCRLKKALYGMKQAPRAWYSRIDAYLQQLGFEKSEADPNLYFIMVGEDPLILLLYVDGIFYYKCKETHQQFQGEPCFIVRDE
jgi:hypothetical protein